MAEGARSYFNDRRGIYFLYALESEIFCWHYICEKSQVMNLDNYLKLIIIFLIIKLNLF